MIRFENGLSLSLSLSLSLTLCVCLFVSHCVYLYHFVSSGISLYLSVCLSVCLSLSIYLSLSVYLRHFSSFCVSLCLSVSFSHSLSASVTLLSKQKDYQDIQKHFFLNYCVKSYSVTKFKNNVSIITVINIIIFLLLSKLVKNPNDYH